jgi:hypothetical protein
MHPAVALDPDGRPMVSKEAVVLISLVKASTGKPSNVVIRGVSPAGLMLRPRVKLVAGRAFAPGSSEIIVGSAIANGFSARSSATACICAARLDRRRHLRRGRQRVRFRDLGRCGPVDAVVPAHELFVDGAAAGRRRRLRRFRPISTSTRAWPTKPSASSSSTATSRRRCRRSSTSWG